MSRRIKMIKREILTLFFVTIIFALGLLYLKNEGTYLIKKCLLSEIDILNEFCEIKLPSTTIIEEFSIKSDIGSNVFSHNEYIEAIVSVPNDQIDILFPEEIREYEEKHILNLNKINTNASFQFGVWKPKTVVKWLDKTQRNINFTVMKEEGSCTSVFVFVDKLGWYRCN